MADDTNHNGYSDDIEEEEEIDEASFRANKDAILFAIEVTPSMLMFPEDTGFEKQRKADRDSPAITALKCAYRLMEQRIISNPGDMLGILLYGTRSSKFYEEEDGKSSDLSYPHCYLLNDLDVPAAIDVRNLREFVENEEKYGDILVPNDEPVSMSNVLFCANQIFTSKAANFSTRRLFIVTDNDSPHSNCNKLKTAAIVRARDLFDLGVQIELFPISRSGRKFDMSKFYEDILYTSANFEVPSFCHMQKSPATGEDGITLLTSLLSSINCRAVLRRAQFSNIPLEIGPDFKISVTGYLILKRQKPTKSCSVWLGGERPQIAKGTATQLAEDSAREVEKWEIKRAYSFGGEPITFTQEEHQALRDFGEPIIRIIGFKSIKSLPFWASMKQPTFIYPSETGYVGSTRVFSALWQTLLQRRKMALVWFIPRKNSTPIMGAMIAGKAKENDTGEQWIPSGMWILPLPYADDIRDNPATNNIVAPKSLSAKMRAVIHELQLPGGEYDPKRYPNPALQWHYRILQALALDENIPEKPEDLTIPKHKIIDKRCCELIREWKNELDKCYPDTGETVVLAKRPASGKQSAVKKPKTQSFSPAEVRAKYEEGELGKLTVPQLKDFLRSVGEPSEGRKAELLDNAQIYIERT